MNKLIALCAFVLSLFGCDGGGTTFVHRSSVDGNDALYSKAHVQAGVARFECLRSESGQCHYTVYPRDCAQGPVAPGSSAVAGQCPTEPARRFAVTSGDSRQVAGLRDFSLCVSADGDVRGPDCEVVAPVAVR